MSFPVRPVRALSTCVGLLVSVSVLCAPVAAQDVTLRSADGAVNLAGPLIDFTGAAYVLRTPLGDLTVPARDVTCEGAACPGPNAAAARAHQRLTGLMPVLLEAFAAHRDAEIQTSPLPNGDGRRATFVGNLGFGDDLGAFSVLNASTAVDLRALRRGSVDIAITSRRRSDLLAGQAPEPGTTVFGATQEHLIAVDSLVVIVHPSNPVQTLTLAQLRGIYGGEITNWEELGGPDLAIVPVTLGPDSAARSIFARYVSKGGSTLSHAVEVATMEGASRMVTAEPGGIGFVGHAFKRDAAAIRLVNQCGFAVQPDTFNARTGEYPLQRRLYLYNRASGMPDLARDFLDYAVSEHADAAIAKAGFIDFGVARQGQGPGTDRWVILDNRPVDFDHVSTLQAMQGQMPDFDRLSTTFRFRSGSSRLDERGRIEIARLVAYLEQEPAGREVRLVGFTDYVGPFKDNLRLSKRRAAIVARELQQIAGDRLSHLTIRTDGYGEIAPSGCNLSEEGQRINRRVEVWVSADPTGSS